MKPSLFQGVATALITPMNQQGIDIKALQQLVEYQIAGGVQALVACGTTGEPSTMSDKEWAEVVSCIIKTVNKRVPVIAGTGGNNTAKVIQMAQTAKELGADAQLCVTPYYNKTTQNGLVAHYKAILDASSLPMYLYNVPSRTSLDMSVSTLATLSKEKNVLGVKEACGDIGKVGDIRALCGEELPIYSGSDENIVPMLSLGSKGVISVLSNFAPDITCKMTEAWFTGDVQKAGELQVQLMPLIRILFSQVNPIVTKAALSLMGMCENYLRLPLVPMQEEAMLPLKQELAKWGLL